MQAMKMIHPRHFSPLLGVGGLVATAILLGVVRGPAVAAGVLALSLVGFAVGYALRRTKGRSDGRILSTTSRMAAVTAKADERLVSLVEVAPEPVLVCAGGRVVYANRAAVTALHCDSAEELTTRNFFDLVEGKDREALAQRLREMLSSGRPAPSAEVDFLCRDGSRATLDVSYLVTEFQGERAIVLLCRDMTERKQLQGHLMLADRLASLGTLAAGVAHEINNPLLYISMNIEFVTSEVQRISGQLGSGGVNKAAELVPQLEALDRPLHEARDGAQRVKDIVRDLRSFSTGGGGERVWPVDICAIMESALRMARNEIKYRAEVVRQYGETPMVDANESRMAQVFLNLLINAAQAIPEGNVPNNEIRISTTTDRAGRAVIQVQDSGVGIPLDVLPRVFDPFFTTKAVGKGTGLGLAIVHRIVTALKGEIYIESQVGSGTKVRIILPPAQGAPQAAEAKPLSPHDVGVRDERRLRVLLIDDETALGTSLRRCISRYWNASFVNDGRQALELLRHDCGYDVIVCDLMMPEVTGMDIYEELVQSKPDLSKRMLFMTGGAFTERARSFLESVPNRHLDKPFDLAQLEAAVRSVAAN
jgi:two-component system cell cycle sensor histidine kinase/response regulator CckA